ncbi:MAG: ADP-ribosylglycohydrolase family protein [Candidatus Brocadiales bacterium]
MGGAIGDALGMPFEGWSPDEIRQRWGDKVFLPSLPVRGLGPGQYTDDTHMTICHLKSLLDSGRLDPEDTARRFIEWFDSGDLRGIGASTEYSMRMLKQGRSWQESGATGEYAAGNGGAMRIAPVGLFYYGDMSSLKEAVRQAVIITHNNTEAVAGAAAVAYIVGRAAGGDLGLDRAINDTREFIGDSAVSENLARTEILLKDEAKPEEVLKVLGTSGYVVETVASAFFCFLSTPGDFRSTVVNAVQGGHDTDTTAAVAGAISGAFNGMSGIPQDWISGLEDNDRLASMAGRLYDVCHKTDGGNGQ